MATIGGVPVSAGDLGLAAAGGLAGGLGGSPTTTTQNGTTIQNNSTTQSGNFNDWLNSLVNSIQNSQGATNNTTSQTGQTVSGTNLDPATLALLQKITAGYTNQATPNLSGYQASGIQGINTNSDLNKQAVANSMAARGLSTSPIAGNADANIEANRFGQINQFNQSIPLLKNSLTNTNLAAGSNFLNTLPSILGQTSTNTGTGSQIGNTVSQQTGQTSTGTSSGGTTYNTGNSSGQTTNQSTGTTGQGASVGGAVGGIASILATLFSDKRLKHDIKQSSSEKAVERILALRPVTWKWKGGDVQDEGFIAQDLQKVIPSLVEKDPAGSGALKVNYGGLISELVGAIQGLHNKMEASVS